MSNVFPSTTRCQSIKQHFQIEKKIVYQKNIAALIIQCDNEEMFFFLFYNIEQRIKKLILLSCGKSYFEIIIKY